MPATPLLDDDAIEAIITGGAAQVARPLASFVDRVRAEGEAAPPHPSPALARLLAEGGAAVADGDAETVLLPHDDGTRQRHNGADAGAHPNTIAHLPATGDAVAARRRGMPGSRRRHLVARVAGAGLAAKLALGTGAAAAGVFGAGMLPGPVGRVARDAIQAVTPIQFPAVDHPVERRGGDDGPDAGNSGADGADGADQHGEHVSPDATGESDGQPGVDGPQVAETAPGADERPDDTPAATGTSTSSTVPPSAPGRPSNPGAPADPGPPPSTPSTTPAPPTTHKADGDTATTTIP
ncbi:MAG TPA: hypothetical protein VFZ79_15555 [Acidimicrobiales bacterium]